MTRLNLGAYEALDYLYKLIGFSPKASPDALFEDETDALQRQLDLLRKAELRGEAGWGAYLGHLDIVCERVTVAAFRKFGDKPKLIEQLERRERVDYGSILTALQGSKLVKYYAGLKVVHDTRSARSEIAHAGEPATADDITAVKQAATPALKGMVGMLEKAASPR